ncbi:MAG: hypothetical protein HPY65_15245 [Syntrophaceae bacterium]|nr:hypothetical protein [Syntrophaceae bacterium]
MQEVACLFSDPESKEMRKQNKIKGVTNVRIRTDVCNLLHDGVGCCRQRKPDYRAPDPLQMSASENRTNISDLNPDEEHLTGRSPKVITTEPGEKKGVTV